jgi:hypothetical protein
MGASVPVDNTQGVPVDDLTLAQLKATGSDNFKRKQAEAERQGGCYDCAHVSSIVYEDGTRAPLKHKKVTADGLCELGGVMKTERVDAHNAREAAKKKAKEDEQRLKREEAAAAARALAAQRELEREAKGHQQQQPRSDNRYGGRYGRRNNDDNQGQRRGDRERSRERGGYIPPAMFEDPRFKEILRNYQNRRDDDDHYGGGGCGASPMKGVTTSGSGGRGRSGR